MQGHPEASHLRTTRTKLYDEMRIIFGNDNAMGQWAATTRDVRAGMSTCSESHTIREVEAEMQDYYQNEADSSLPTASKSKKRHEERINEAEKYRKSMIEMNAKMG